MSDVETLRRENEALRRERDDLLCQLEALREICSDDDFCPGFVLPRRQLQILRVLMKRKSVTRQQLYDLIYAYSEDPADDLVVQSHISKLRTTLKARGIDLRPAARFCGYSLDDADKAKLRAEATR